MSAGIANWLSRSGPAFSRPRTGRIASSYGLEAGSKPGCRNLEQESGRKQGVCICICVPEVIWYQKNTPSASKVGTNYTSGKWVKHFYRIAELFRHTYFILKVRIFLINYSGISQNDKFASTYCVSADTPASETRREWFPDILQSSRYTLHTYTKARTSGSDGALKI